MQTSSKGAITFTAIVLGLGHALINVLLIVGTGLLAVWAYHTGELVQDWGAATLNGLAMYASHWR